MADSSLKKKTISNLIWKFCERILAQLITTIVSIVLARILLPEDYGAVALITAFVNLCNVFVVKGFYNSLIQKKDADDVDFSTVFYINLIMTVIVYGALFVSAKFIANYYEMPILCPLLRVMGLRIPCAAINSIQSAAVARKLQFKKYFYSTLTGTLLSAVVGIALALTGAGAWALVAQYLTNSFVDTIFLWFTVKWRPKLVFSKERAKGLFSYGWKLLAASLFDEFCNEIRSFAIGKKYTAADLAYYSKGNQFPKIIDTNIDASISSVLFPVLAKAQDNKDDVKRYTRKAIKTSAYIMFPMLMGLAAVSKQFVIIVLTDKWLETVPFMQIICISYMFAPLQTANLQAIKALGRSDYFLKLNIIKNIMRITIVVATIPFGMKWVVVGSLISTICTFFVNAGPNKKLLNYGYFDQIKDVIPLFFLAAFMGVVVYVVGLLDINIYLLLAIQVTIGIIIYILGSIIFKFEGFELVLGFIKDIMSKKKVK